jgi:hypothetical protein
MRNHTQSDWGLWRARCIERCPPGSGSGPGKRISRKADTALRADFHRPQESLIVAFVDELRSDGHAVELICRVLREQDCEVATRTYPEWKRVDRHVADRVISDAQVVGTVRDIAWTIEPEGRRKLAREGLYGRRKMTALVRRRIAGRPGRLA